MSIPILGNNAHTIPPQLRLNAQSMAEETIQCTRQLGLKIGRIKLQMDLQANDPIFPLLLEELEERGCQLIAVNETPIMMGPGNGALLISVLVRIPAAMAQA